MRLRHIFSAHRKTKCLNSVMFCAQRLRAYKDKEKTTHKRYIYSYLKTILVKDECQLFLIPDVGIVDASPKFICTW